MYLIPEGVQLKDAIIFAYKNGLSIDSMADAEVGAMDSTVVLERNLTDARSENIGHVQAGVTLVTIKEMQYTFSISLLHIC